MGIEDFVREYFVNPMQYPDKYAPYNTFNTLAYALVAIAAVYVIFKILKKINIRVDKDFYTALISFVVFGSAVRVITDAGILPRSVELFGQTLYPFITPGIYLLVFFVVAASIGVSLWLSRKKGSFYSWMETIGTVLAVLALLALAPLLAFFGHGLLMLLLAAVGPALFEGLNRFLKSKSSFVEKFTVFSQCVDGAATFVGIGIGTPAKSYGEQHVVGNFIIDAIGNPFAFYVIKVLFALAVVFLIRRELSEKKPDQAEEKNYILLIITIFGLAPGVRDALRIIAGV